MTPCEVSRAAAERAHSQVSVARLPALPGICYVSCHSPIRQAVLGAIELAGFLEAKLLVEPLRDLVVPDYNEFDDLDSLCSCLVHKCCHKLCPQVLAAMFVGDRQAKGCLGSIQIPQETPANDLTSLSRDQIKFSFDSRPIILDDLSALVERGLQ